MSLEALQKRVVPRDPEPVQALLKEKYGVEVDGQEQEDKKDRIDVKGIGLDGYELQLLMSINANPCLPQSRRAQELGLNTRLMSNRKERLREKGLIGEGQYRLSGDKRKANYHWLTSRGRKVVGDLGIRPETIHGHLPHHCRIRELEVRYRADYKTMTDQRVGDRRPDIWCEHKRTGETGVVEVVMSPNSRHELAKVAAMADRARWIHVYCESANTKRHFERLFRDELPEGVYEKLSFSTLP